MTTTEPHRFDATGGGPLPHDPLPPIGDDPDLVDVDKRTNLGRLVDELNADLEPEDVVLTVPRRPGWSVTYSAGIDGDTAEAWTRRARKGNTGAVDQLRYACIVLANTCTAIRKNGEPISDQGDDVTFRDRPFLELMGVGRAVDAVRKFYGGPRHLGDGAIIAAAGEVLTAAGYNDTAERADPLEDPTPG